MHIDKLSRLRATFETQPGLLSQVSIERCAAIDIDFVRYKKEIQR